MRLIAFLLLATLLDAQTIQLGIRGGLRLTGDLAGQRTDATSESKRYILGPMVVVRLPWRTSIEFDALYSRLGYRESLSYIGGFSSSRYRAHSWEFPFLIRKSLQRGMYLGAGYSPRRITGMSHSVSVIYDPLAPNPNYNFFEGDSSYSAWSKITHGIVGVAGFESRWGRLTLAPEVRYTRWTSPAIDLNGPHGYSLQSTQDQVLVLLGISF